MPYYLTPSGARRCGNDLVRKNPFCAALLAACAFVGASLMEIVPAEAALQAGAERLPALPEAHISSPPPETVQALSGSAFPGVIDHLLEVSPTENVAAIHINYPSLGHKHIDADIRSWVTELADAFSSHLDPVAGTGDSIENINEAIEAVLNGVSQPDRLPAPHELWGAYHVSRPSGAAVSIDFELWNYTGSAEGNLDIITLNYSLLTGQRLNFVDIFEKPDVALQLMSAWSRAKLAPMLGAARRTHMLETGTAPLIENFSSFSLTPDGICINFQPWQVAPSEAGIQKVNMPLTELMPSAPLLVLWGKGDIRDENAGTD